MNVRKIRDLLASERETFRAGMDAQDATATLGRFAGRIGVVLGGGGGRGAYQAGVLLALQDAKIPTHLITGVSIGGINAASYAAQGEGYVGNAEHMVRTWMRLTPLAVGIDWSRYIWKLVGLIAASAGIGNFLWVVLELRGFHLELPHPLVTWALLALVGLAVLLLYDDLPYFGYMLRPYLSPGRWPRPGKKQNSHPHWGKAARSICANVLIWGSLAAILVSVGALKLLADLLHPAVSAAALIAVGGSISARVFAPRFIGTTLHNFFRAPFRRGLFTNFNRIRLLRRAIPDKKLRESPIRLVFPATDVEGPCVYFSNVSPETLASDPKTNAEFAQQVTVPHDMILALAATSAIPLAFEPVRFRGRLLSDGGLVAGQPVRPAVKLGADVLFIVMMDPMVAPQDPVQTFVDMGMRALNILLAQAFLADIKTLNSVNEMCRTAAGTLGLRPEDVELDVGTRRYRYVKEFTIFPSRPLTATVLDFGGRSSARAILQGYRDATAQIIEFLDYAKTSSPAQKKKLLRLQAVVE